MIVFISIDLTAAVSLITLVATNTRAPVPGTYIEFYAQLFFKIIATTVKINTIAAVHFFQDGT